MKIGWIGLGKMGLPMARRILAAGHEVTAFVRSEAKAGAAREAGFAVQTRIDRLAPAVDALFSAVSDDAALRDIVFGPQGLGQALPPGRVFVDTSTVSPTVSQEVDHLLTGRGVAYLRCPISGSTGLAEQGKLTALVSGPTDAYQRLEPVIAAFAVRRFLLGPGEEARVLKLAINSMVAGTAALVAEALAFAAKGGLAPQDAIAVIAESAVASPLIGYKRALVESGRYEAAFGVSQIMKDLDLLLGVGREVHCPLPVASLVRQLYELAWLDGKGGQDFFVLVQQAIEAARVGQAPQ